MPYPFYANEFLSDLAKSYDTRIEYVEFSLVSENRPAEVHAARNGKGRKFRILIDKAKARCTRKILFGLCHEIGHVILDHFEFGGKWQHVPLRCLTAQMEAEANKWAFNELEMLDPAGAPKPDYILCHKCITAGSGKCLKETAADLPETAS